MRSVFISLVLMGLLMSCSAGDGESMVDCSSAIFEVELKVTSADCGLPAGQVSLVALGSTVLTAIRIEDGPWLSSTQISGLRPGLYSLGMRDQNDCESTIAFTLPSTVSFERDVRPIIETKCAIPACHDGSGNIDYRTFANLARNPADVKARTQSGDMPRGGVLTAEERAFIACWVDAGAPDN